MLTPEGRVWKQRLWSSSNHLEFWEDKKIVNLLGKLFESDFKYLNLKVPLITVERFSTMGSK
jgi:hypothetical protein